jgi:transcriptional regulator with PAS, ATPase and Fis domain
MLDGDVEQLIGTSSAIKRIDSDLDAAAHSDAKVLITGESGVGKEVVARLIHQRSSRRNARLLTINCAGLPDSLLESELFGHVRGAFTGAYRDKTGLLELGNHGTVFMDEVGEMSLRMQAVLLRFLETGEIHRVGGDRAHTRVNVRVIAATNRDLKARVRSREFREDLYFRLNVIHLALPPVRERREDVPALLNHFFSHYCLRQQMPVPEITADAMARLVAYDWPGNVREMRNLVQRLTLRARTTPIDVADLPSEIVPPAPAPRREHPCGTYSQVLFDRITKGGESFWTAVYEPFRSHDLTRDDLRGLIRMGLEKAGGSYRVLLELFGLPAEDYKRVLNFLRTHECQMPMLRLRPANMSMDDRSTVAESPAVPMGRVAGGLRN